MSKFDILNFLRNNTNSYFSADELSKHFDIHIRTIMKNLSGLEKEKDIESKEIYIKNNKTGYPIKMYRFILKDNVLEESIFDLNNLKADKRFDFMSTDLLMDYLILKELKQLNKNIEVKQNENKQ